MHKATKDIICILDAKLEKADIQNKVDQYLSKSQQNIMLLLHLKYQELFNGALLNWDIEPIRFQMNQGCHFTC